MSTQQCTAAALDAIRMEWHQAADLATEVSENPDIHHHLEAVHAQALRLDRIMNALLAIEPLRRTL